jgi:ketosteroid isomerase-like protein
MKTLTKKLIGALALLATGAVFSTMAAETDRVRAAIESQALALHDATQRGDAAAIANLFTVDAKVGVSGTNGIVAGRAAIQNFWQAAVSGGMKGLSLKSDGLEGSGDLRVETGRYSVQNPNGVEVGTGNYLIVWKKEAGTWKVHRDYAHASAPSVNRAGLPANYRSEWAALGAAFNEGNSEITATYANAAAGSVERASQLPYPEGAEFLMEFASARRDGEGQLMRDPTGQVLKGEILHIDVMRKGRAEGANTSDVHAGGWDFASYRPDGSVAVAPSDAAHCASCHRNAGAEQDFVFRQRAPLSR